MKVLLVTESYWPNADGGALYERRLANGMADRGHNVTIWAPGDLNESYIEHDPPTLIEREKAIQFVFNTKYRVSYWPWWRARTLIRKHRPDIIHIHNFYWMGLAALFWAKRYRIPVIGTNHFMPENLLLNLKWLKPISPLVHRLVWIYLVNMHNRCNFVTSPTPTAIDLLRKHGLKTPHKAISNGVDTHLFRPGLSSKAIAKKYSIPTDKPILLYFGRLDGEKRIDIIIDSLPEILKSTDIQLVLAGTGISQPALEAQAKKLGVTDHVIFTGFVDEEDKPHIYNAATLFVLASPAELQSIVTLEAMACGLPLVLVDVAALHELCHDGKNGYLFAENNATMLAKKAVTILKNTKIQQQFGRASRLMIESEHATSIMFDGYEAAYKACQRLPRG